MATTQTSFEAVLQKAIQLALKSEIEKAAEVIKKNAITQLEHAVTRIVSDVAVNTEEWVNIERFEKNLRIEVKLSKNR